LARRQSLERWARQATCRSHRSTLSSAGCAVPHTGPCNLLEPLACCIACPPRYPHKAPICHATYASMALYAQATRLLCYACEQTGALVASPDAPLTRSCMLSCLLAASDQGRSYRVVPVGRRPPYARPNPTRPIGSVRTRSVAQDLPAAAVNSSPIVFFAFLLSRGVWCNRGLVGYWGRWTAATQLLPAVADPQGGLPGLQPP
jgi:hypothetical protein